MRVATNPTRIAGSAETKETRPDAKEALSKSAAEHAGVRPTAQYAEEINPVSLARNR